MTAPDDSQRPSINPDVLAAILSGVPERLQKKLDREPRAADGWEWTLCNDGWQIKAGDETVVVPNGVITEVAQVKCSCLLSPRCFHVVAVLNVARIESGVSEESLDALAEAGDSNSAAENDAVSLVSVSNSNVTALTAARTGVEAHFADVVVSTGQQRAIRLMFDASAGILATGLRAAGAVLQSRLLRAIHECRSEGLHRLASGGLRLMNNIRQLRDGADGFSSESAANDFLEVLETCTRLNGQEPDVKNPPSKSARSLLPWIGIARRSFEPVRSLKLHAMCCEPILTRSGYSGVVTWLMAGDGWIGTVSDVQPGAATRIPQAWQSGVSLAGLSISHREFSRKCLLISRATRSIDGRLGGGDSARAVVIDGQGWDAEPIAARFRIPLAEQIRAAFSQQAESDFLRAAGTDLVFFTAIVVGYSGNDLVVLAGESQSPTRLSIALDVDAVMFRTSLQMLSRAPGLMMRCIGRIDFQAAGRVRLLAIASPPDGTDGETDRPVLVLPSTEPVWSIGLQALTRSQLSKAESAPVPISPGDSESSPMEHYDESMERWLRAIVIGGRHAIPESLLSGVTRDAARLQAALRPASAAWLRGLTQSSSTTRTDIAGVRIQPPPSLLAYHWLAASIGSQATRRYLQLQSWLKMLDST